MKTYIRYLLKIFFTSLLFVTGIIFSLVLILNLLSELEFFKDLNVDTYFPIILSFLNSPDMIFLTSISIITGIIITFVFYNFSSNLKNYYLQLKSPYAADGKYLAVITNNGLWIKDEIDGKVIITNSSEINQNFLIDNFITQFNKDYEIIQNIKSYKIDISNKEWVVFDPKILNNNASQSLESIKINTNFDYKRIRSLYSNFYF